MASSIIRALAPATINKIAAGEVIERPANAVKELVENALDARAGKVTVTLEEGGLELIKVSDDGHGMVREDVLLAWLPHTTSKIREAEDLTSVATYGFRGEALCSMAAVAELTIETRHASEPTGTALTISGGAAGEPREIMRNPGTTITVRNLFLHSPVRRKFMGTGRTESARILGMLGRVALAHPGTAFKVVDKGREALSLVEGTLKHRVGEIVGYNITNDLVPVEWTDGRNGSAGSLRIEGYVSTAQQARQRANHQYFFINRRAIQSGLIARALSQSYEVLPPGRYPMGVLYLTLPTEEVDVNVHPTKKEVRFLDESRIYWSVSQAVKSALRKDAGAPMLDLGFPGDPAPAHRETVTLAFPSSVPPPPRAGEAAPAFRFADYSAPATPASHPARSPGAGLPAAPDSPLQAGQAPPSAASDAYQDRRTAAFPAAGALPPTGGQASHAGYAYPAEPALSRVAEPADPLDPSAASGRHPHAHQLRLFPGASGGRPGAGETRGGSGIPYLQIHNGFILFEVQGGLSMVNQQAAHERILYEKALEDLRQPGRFHSQQLLFPEVVEFTPGDGRFLEENLSSIQALGFDLEAFGGNTFQLRGLPMEVRPDQARRVMSEMMAGLLRPERGGAGPRGEEFVQRLARIYARVTSVKLGDPLDYQGVAALVDGLFATQNPYVSPSGAPIVVRLSLDEIHRKFGLKP